MRGGFPHSETPGSKPARGSPGLVAACRVLHRLSAPRHPPGALLSLAPPRRPRRRGQAPRPLTMPTNDYDYDHAAWQRHAARPDMSRTRLHTRRARHKGARARRLAAARCKRTPPPRRCRRRRRLVGPGRLERPTSRLSGARSNRLSYGPGPARTTRGGSGWGSLRWCRGKGRADGAPGTDRRAAAAPAGALGLLPSMCADAAPPRRTPLRARAGPRRPQKGGDPAAGSPTATLLRLHPSRRPGRGRPPPPSQGVGQPASGRAYSHGVTGGVYKARERIHRGVLIRDY
jgi:hypothetical protein